jgi:peptide/nickel transport system permease protein
MANKTGLLGMGIVLASVALAVVAPLITSHDPYAANPAARLQPPIVGAHVLGTDQLGRDMLTRILLGGRVSLAVGFLAVAIAAPLGVLLGLLAGYCGSAPEQLLGRLADAQLAIPFILLAIAVLGVLGASPLNVILVLGVTGWPIYLRVTRSTVLAVKKAEYVQASRALGGSHLRIMLRHILPNTLSPTVVIATFAVAQTITLEATLSFLGLGIQPPVPSWGQMLADGKSYLNVGWWLSTFPGLAIAFLVIGINLLGDAVRDLLDPRLDI